MYRPHFILYVSLVVLFTLEEKRSDEENCCLGIEPLKEERNQ